MGQTPARPYLVKLPEGQPRPDAHSAAVLLKAIPVANVQLRDWLEAAQKLRQLQRATLPLLVRATPPTPPEQTGVDAALMDVLGFASLWTHGTPDAYAVAVALDRSYGWPMDFAGVRLLAQIIDNLHVAHRVAIGEWAFLNQLKYPAACDELIEWTGDAGKDTAGKVLSLDRVSFDAIVQPAGTYAAANAKRVHGEQVYANITKGDYALDAVTDGALQPSYIPLNISNAAPCGYPAIPRNTPPPTVTHFPMFPELDELDDVDVGLGPFTPFGGDCA